MNTDDHGMSKDPLATTSTTFITGMRPVRRGGYAARDPMEDAGTVWGPLAAVAWLLALTPGAVIATKSGFFMPALIAVFQVALIVVVLMRFAWGKKIHLLVLGIGALFSALLLTMISLDRSEYRSELEQFETTVRGVVDTHDD
jgi:hypothetical protein